MNLAELSPILSPDASHFHSYPDYWGTTPWFSEFLHIQDSNLKFLPHFTFYSSPILTELALSVWFQESRRGQGLRSYSFPCSHSSLCPFFCLLLPSLNLYSCQVTKVEGKSYTFLDYSNPNNADHSEAFPGPHSASFDYILDSFSPWCVSFTNTPSEGNHHLLENFWIKWYYKFRPFKFPWSLLQFQSLFVLFQSTSKSSTASTLTYSTIFQLSPSLCRHELVSHFTETIL